MIENIKTTKARGLERMDQFISRFTDFKYPGRNENKRASYYDSIKKEKVVSFQTVKKKTPVTIPLDESKSFGEILSRFEEKILNLRMIMDWPVTSKPYTIAAEDGKVCSNSKSLFRNYLQCLCQVKPSSDPSMDGESVRKILKMLKLTNTNAILMKVTTIMYYISS